MASCLGGRHVLFFLSVLAFIASSIRSGDTVGLVGGIFFRLACFVFVIPYAMTRDKPQRTSPGRLSPLMPAAAPC